MRAFYPEIGISSAFSQIADGSTGATRERVALHNHPQFVVSTQSLVHDNADGYAVAGVIGGWGDW